MPDLAASPYLDAPAMTADAILAKARDRARARRASIQRQPYSPFRAADGLGVSDAKSIDRNGIYTHDFANKVLQECKLATAREQARREARELDRLAEKERKREEVKREQAQRALQMNQNMAAAAIKSGGAAHLFTDQGVLDKGFYPKVSHCIYFASILTGVPPVDILSVRRTKGNVFARHLAMYLAKRDTVRSLPEIGRDMGGRDHTTVLHAAANFEAKAKARGFDIPAPGWWNRVDEIVAERFNRVTKDQA